MNCGTEGRQAEVSFRTEIYLGRPSYFAKVKPVSLLLNMRPEKYLNNALCRLAVPEFGNAVCGIMIIQDRPHSSANSVGMSPDYLIGPHLYRHRAFGMLAESNTWYPENSGLFLQAP